jgi:hypothetical protein
MNGLGNRMRALGSAIATAELYNLDLIAIWPTDSHMTARFDELFEVGELKVFHTLTYSDVSKIVHSKIEYYDYMDQSVQYRELQLDKAFVYVRSAFVLNVTGLSKEKINEGIRSLRPCALVMEYIQRANLVERDPILGVHMRTQSVQEEQELSIDSSEYSTRQRDLIDTYRKKTANSLSWYFNEINHFLETNWTVFLAADKPLNHSITTKCKSIKGIHCTSRETQCVQVALAELLILGKCSVLLGSYWSSFTEVAARIANVTPRYPPSIRST